MKTCEFSVITRAIDDITRSVPNPRAGPIVVLRSRSPLGPVIVAEPRGNGAQQKTFHSLSSVTPFYLVALPEKSSKLSGIIDRLKENL